jgi:hypothetical protein
VQFQNVLSLEEREAENLLIPQEPAYLQLIEQAIDVGLHVPTPPPVLIPEEPLTPAEAYTLVTQVQPVLPPIAIVILPQVQQQQPPPTQMADRFNGNPPNIFNGSRKQSVTFLCQFNLFKGLNETHVIMTNSYFHTIFILSYIKGPNIDDWVVEQVDALNEKTTRAQNCLDRIDEALWNDFNTAFTTTFTDTAKKQVAHQKLMALKMYKDNIDSYIATFRSLVKAAGYDCNAKGTMHLFAQGLRPELLKEILYSNNIPDTIDNWEKQACKEIKKNALRETMLHPNRMHYK